MVELSYRLPVIYGFARSGGTLVNRCLGAISGNLVLSEVNPHASVFSVEQQAQDWLHLITAQQLRDFSQKSYRDKIAYLVRAARLRNCYLIIRDWTSVNFLANVIPGDCLTPSGILEQQLYLLHGGFEQNCVVITRKAADVYESLKRTFEQQFDHLSVEEFGILYLNYAKAVCHHPIVHYEQICINPEAEIQRICNLLEVNYDSCFLDKFSHFDQCTGDNLLKEPSRGMQLDVIRPLRSNQESPFYIAASLNQNCQKVDELFYYED